MEVVYAPHFVEASQSYGCRDHEIRSGRSVADVFAAGNIHGTIQPSVIVSTRDRGPFYPWHRLKVRRGTMRVIVDFLDENTMLVHAVIPRWTETYDEALDLWKRYRRRNDGK